MTRDRALSEKLALSILAREGIAAVWQLHLAAADAHRTGHPIAAASILEIADAAEAAWLRAERRAGVRSLVGCLVHCSTLAIVKFDSRRLKIARVMFKRIGDGKDGRFGVGFAQPIRHGAQLFRPRSPSLGSFEWVHHQPAYEAASLFVPRSRRG
jgi:hypothetical protein